VRFAHVSRPPLYSSVRAVFSRCYAVHRTPFRAEPTIERLSNPELGVTHYLYSPGRPSAIDDPAFRPGNFPRLKAIFTGRAPRAPDPNRALRRSGHSAGECFGMSESGNRVYDAHRFDTSSRKPKIRRAVGPRRRGSAWWNRRKTNVTPGEAGRSLAERTGITPGYWNQPEVTA